MSGKSPPPQTSTTNTTQLYSPEEAARRAKLMAEAERVYGTTAGVAQNMPGPAPSADTLRAQQMMRDTAGGGMQQTADLMPWATQFGMEGVLSPTTTPGFQEALGTATRKVTEAYEGPTGPFANIRSGFTAGNSGGTGSREGIAMGMAGRDYLNTIGDVSGRMTMDAYSKGLDTFSRTMALAPQNMAAMGMPAQAVGAVGQQTEGYENQARQWEMDAPWAALGPYSNIVSGMSNPSTSSTSTTPGPRAASPANMMLSGALAGTAIGGGPGWGTAIGAGAGLMLSLFS